MTPGDSNPLIAGPTEAQIGGVMNDLKAEALSFESSIKFNQNRGGRVGGCIVNHQDFGQGSGVLQYGVEASSGEFGFIENGNHDADHGGTVPDEKDFAIPALRVRIRPCNPVKKLFVFFRHTMPKKP